jgi:hypothetical protein
VSQTYGSTSHALGRFPKTQWLVKATDPKRPGWSFVWGGSQTREGAETIRRDCEAQSGTGHLRFVVVAVQ